MELLRFRQEIENPSSFLSTCTKPLVSKQFNFITSLCITTNCFVSDLVGLTEITNLGALQIIKPIGQEILESHRINDRLVRAWHEAALDGAFTVLRILRLWGHEDITSRSLNYLNNFQSLALYDVRDCGFDCASQVRASELGWMACVNKEILDVLDAACEEKLAMAQPSSEEGPALGLNFGRKQLYDTAKVQFVPRADMSALSASQNASVSDSLELWSDSTTWDFVTTTSFSRIGLLRNDLDLVKAGVPTMTHALVGKELVNSVPMASVCLGTLPNQHECPRRSQMRLFFVRTNTSTSKLSSSAVGSKERSRGSENVTDHPEISSKSAKKQRGAPTSMRVKKKQKLDDILNSFQ